LVLTVCSVHNSAAHWVTWLREGQQEPSTTAFIQQHLLDGLGRFVAVPAVSTRFPKPSFHGVNQSFEGKCDILVVPSWKREEADNWADPTILLHSALVGFQLETSLKWSHLPQARLGFWMYATSSNAPYMHVSPDWFAAVTPTISGRCAALESAMLRIRTQLTLKQHDCFSFVSCCQLPLPSGGRTNTPSPIAQSLSSSYCPDQFDASM